MNRYCIFREHNGTETCEAVLNAVDASTALNAAARAQGFDSAAQMQRLVNGDYRVVEYHPAMGAERLVAGR